MNNRTTPWLLAAAVGLLVTGPAAADGPNINPWSDEPNKQAERPLDPSVIDPWKDDARRGDRNQAVPDAADEAYRHPLLRERGPGLSDAGASMHRSGGLGIGVAVQPLNAELRHHFGAPQHIGVLVIQIGKDGLGASAGLRVGDVLLKVDDTSISSPRGLHRALHHKPGGTTVTLTVVRAKRIATLRFTFPIPKPEDAASVARKQRIRQLRSELTRLKRQMATLEKRLQKLENGVARGGPRLGSRQ